MFTNEICCEILRKKYGSTFKILNFEQTGEDASSGLLSKPQKLRITFETESGSKCDSFFVKEFPADGKNNLMADFLISSDSFNKEYMSYQIFEDYNRTLHTPIKFSPSMYYYKQNKVVVFEDLNALGYRMFQGRHMDVKHVKFTLNAIAKFHGTSLAYEVIKSKENKRKFDMSEYDSLVKETLFRNDQNSPIFKFLNSAFKGLLAAVDLIPECSLDRQSFKTKLEEYFMKMFTKPHEHLNLKKVLTHSDLWSNNVMFQYRNHELLDCRLLDFQLVTYNYPSFDVLYFIFDATTEENRKEYLGEYLEFYYRQLTFKLKNYGIEVDEVLPKTDFLYTCKLVMPHIKMYFALNETLSLNDKKEFCPLENEQEHVRVIFDDRSSAVKELFGSQPKYRQKMITIMKMLEDMVLTDVVTKEDCFVIAKNTLKSTNYDLDSFEVKQYGEVNGFLGEHLQLKLMVNYDGPSELNYFIKRVPRDPSLQWFAKEVRASFKESHFYTTYQKKLLDNNIDVLEDVLASCVFENKHDMIVFEDLKHLQYKTLASRRDINLETVEICLISLAKLHASCLILEELESVKRGQHYRLTDDFQDQLSEAFYRKNFTSYQLMSACKYGHRTIVDIMHAEGLISSDKEVTKSLILEGCNMQKHFVAPSIKYRNTICHADAWSKNLMVKYQGDQPINCKIVDFQTYRYGPPAQDFMAFLHLNVRRNLRVEHFDHLLDVYYNQLKKSLSFYDVDITGVLKWEEFLESCEYYRQFALTQATTHLQCITLGPEMVSKLLKNPEVARTYFFMDKSEFLAEAWRKDEIFKERLSEVMLDLIEFYENKKL